ncbi:peptidoglycan-binding domain-containing protein [uncultured Tateyamaria sp.]|uniref:peptidoglycan-binding domain-containing protein n=1 Tax=uncultured Tateyamaria sp. TaxID=455651 RepID=UPI002605EBF1|nr:peptidoglycan-binding domain-containing protein [uncultured Tateyamaria sp.]
MFTKSIAVSCVALSMAIVPATRVTADAGDFVAGAIIGGIVGHAATKQNQRKKATQRTYTRKTYRPGIPSTQAGREIQASLNYFGFNAGTVDGQLGRRSRNAISAYQAYLGYPATGQLTPFEQNLLITSYNRAQAGGYAVNQQVAANPDGTRGLLKTYRAEMAGQPTTPAFPQQGTTIVVAPQPVAPALGTTTTTTVVAAAPEVQAPEPEAPVAEAGLPNFLGGGATASLASHCNTVSLLTNTNGGFTTAAAMTDPNVALNEQFCLARTYAIAKSEDMIAKVQGFTTDQIASQCAQFGPAMQTHVAALALKSQPEVVQDVASFILTTGMSPAQLKGTAQICMGVGYRTDNMDVALGSALLLFAMGDHVYGEMMGHHLAQGFGTTKRIDSARVWYAEGLKAVDAGAPAVFAPGQPERVELLRQASLQLGTSNSSLTAPAQPTVQPAALPTFGVSSN